MKAFKWEKHLIMMFCGDTDAVVPNAKLPKVSVFLRRNLNVWIYVWTAVLDRVSNQVLKYLPEVQRLSHGDGKLVGGQFCVVLSDSDLQITEGFSNRHLGIYRDWFDFSHSSEAGKLQESVDEP
jgi:hypothetical protein